MIQLDAFTKTVFAVIALSLTAMAIENGLSLFRKPSPMISCGSEQIDACQIELSGGVDLSTPRGDAFPITTSP